MKRRIITPLLFLFFITGFSQNLGYEVHGKYSDPIKKETLSNAQFASDIIPNYPANLIMDYASVDILTTCDGKAVNAFSTSNALNAEQKNILNTADLGAEIVISINYKYSRVRYSTRLVPEIEAEYPAGYQQLTKYLNENVITKIPGADPKEFKEIIISFIVDENGKIANPQINMALGGPETDKLLEAMNKMPKWKPAENSKGEKVKQKFEFSTGKQGC